MKFRSKILAMLLAMTLGTNKGLAWDDEQKQDTGNKRKFIVAGLVTVGVVATSFIGFKAWRYFKPTTKTLGIDLGTTNSAVGYGGELIKVGDKTTMPSAVHFGEGGKVTVGEEALEFKETLISLKRIIGADYNAVKKHAKDLPFELVEGDNGWAAVKVVKDGETIIMRPEDVAAEVLKKLKQNAEQQLGHKFDNVVITVPAYFDILQKETTLMAANKAGFKDVTFLQEPTARVVANAEDIENGKYLVYDWGGGTMDVSVVEVKEVKRSLFTKKKKEKGLFTKKWKELAVKANPGNSYLGGDNIDERLMDKFFKEFKEINKDIKFKDEEKARESFRKIAKTAKEELQKADEPYIIKEKIKIDGKEFEFNRTINLTEFNETIDDLVEETMQLTLTALKDAKVDSDDIDKVLLVGGSSHLKLVRKKLHEMFPGKELDDSINPDEAVARGAMRYAQFLDERKNVKLIDITPITIGIETANDGFTKVISKGSPVTDKQKIDNLRPLHEDQTTVVVLIRQGEGERASENKIIGAIKIKDIPKDNQNIIVSIFLDESTGVVKVEATNNGKPVFVDITRENLDNLRKEYSNVFDTDVAEKTDEVLEEGAENQLEQLQQLLKGVQNKEELVDALQEMLNKQTDEVVEKAVEKAVEKVQEISDKVLKDNKLTRAEIKEVKDMLTKSADSN